MPAKSRYRNLATEVPGRFAPQKAQLGLDAAVGAEMTIEGDALVLRRPARPARSGWAKAAKKIAEAGDDALVMGEFGNTADAELAW